MVRKIVALEKIFSTYETNFHSCPVTLHQYTESGTKYMSVNFLLLKYQTDEYGIKDEIGGNEQTFE